MAASSSPADFLHALKHEVHCSVCLELFTDPQALTCLHTFCNRCLAWLNKQNIITCPNCRKCTGVNDVVDNFQAKRLVEIYKRESDKQQQTCIDVAPRRLLTNKERDESCHGCEICKKNIIDFVCDTCGKYTCTPCRQTHVRCLGNKCLAEDAVPIEEKLKQVMTTISTQLELLELQEVRLLKFSNFVTTELRKSTKEHVKGLQWKEEQDVQRIRKLYEEQRRSCIHLAAGAVRNVWKRCNELNQITENTIEHINEVRNGRTIESLKYIDNSLLYKVKGDMEKYKKKLWEPLLPDISQIAPTENVNIMSDAQFDNSESWQSYILSVQEIIKHKLATILPQFSPDV